ncbi:MAG: hypothetical protein IPN01_10060 [Deltaproteobacteria bacterium]|nr:hypothetical protein [Deltaproteobacteria bacterium]
MTNFRRLVTLLPLPFVFLACETNEVTENIVFEGDYAALFAQLDHSDLTVVGGAVGSGLEVKVTSWGTAVATDKAQDRLDGNSYTATAEGEVVSLNSRSTENRAGVDFDVRSPEFLSLDVAIASGHAHLEYLEGTHLVTASSVRGEGLIGEIDAYAESGDNVIAIWPYENARIRIETWSGDNVLTLPYGLDYDLTIVGDPEYAMNVEDLGFDVAYASGAAYVAQRGAATIRVEVFTSGGDTTIYAD